MWTFDIGIAFVILAIASVLFDICAIELIWRIPWKK